MPITITIRKNGPYFIHADDLPNVRLVDHEGNELAIPGKDIALCRCGGSSKKPFCDKTHRSIGFDSVVAGREEGAAERTIPREPFASAASRSPLPASPTLDTLEDRLSQPTAGVIDVLGRVPGDIIILGAGGKMGPSLARMAKRAVDSLGDGRRVIAVSRFSSETAVAVLQSAGVDVVRAELGDRDALAQLPDAPNVIYMAGQKFGTSDRPSRTWWVNTVVPALVGERYVSSRIVAFSTGNVYPLTAVDGPGSREGDALVPLGEYANSTVGRERVLEELSRARGTPLALIRLSYAVDLRYGVLVDIGWRVHAGVPIDLRTGFVNVIWQGDANAQTLQALPHAGSPPLVVNVTGPERLRVREVAETFGQRFGREPVFTGAEAPDALLSDTSRARSLFGPPEIDAATLIDWVADWITQGGPSLGKGTGYEVRDGRF
jgi:CDGSH-type Zn-finger protein